MTAISVVIPTLREEQRIERLLRLLRAQEYSGPVEIIVVDGASEDKTQEVVRCFPEVQLLIEPERGTSRQRNRGAVAARHELLVFMDADNAPTPDFLSRIAKAYEQKPFAVACPWYRSETRNVVIHLLHLFLNGLFWVSQWRFHSGSGVCIITRKEAWEKTGGFVLWLHTGEDVYFVRQAARYGPHRHLLIPLLNSARRFEEHGLLKMLILYVKLSRHFVSGNFEAIRDIPYEYGHYGKS